jgi:trehalose 6-phosphate phosphatase
VCDYDGTLAPIVNDPARAVALERSLDALRRLTPHLGLVAVVSGRPIEFLRTRIAIDGVVLVGQYGLEKLVEGEIVVDPRALPYVDAVSAAASDAERQWPELLVERKGGIAFTIHWRTAPGSAPGSADLRAFADRHGLALQPARMGCELRPSVGVDKGTAFHDVVAEVGLGGFVAYAGDDDGDLAAFRMDFGDPGAAVQPIRVAVWSPETPLELLELADLAVRGPEGLADALGDLAEMVSPGAPP